MSFAIDKIVATAMQRIVVRIVPATPTPLRYEIRMVGESTEDEIEDSFEGSLYISRGLYAPEAYSLEITAVYADPDDNQVLTVSGPVTVNPQESMATVLRQSLWDILFDSALVVDGRAVSLLHDGLLRPMIVRRSEVVDVQTPFIEVGMPLLRTTQFQSNTRKTEEWRLQLRLLDDLHKENPDELTRMWHLAEMVQAAVDGTENLNLAGRGVLDKAWSWRVMEDPDPQRDRLSGLRMWLTVFVNRPIGAVGSRR